MQVRSGSYFLHEHPAQATSWRLPVVTEFCARYPHLYAVTADMCQFGLSTPAPRVEEMPAKKPTRWLTNSPCLAETLERPCPRDHVHEPLMGGRAKAAQVYPPGLCAAVVAGFAEQLRVDLRPFVPDGTGSARQETRGDPSDAPMFNLEILQVDRDDG